MKSALGSIYFWSLAALWVVAVRAPHPMASGDMATAREPAG